jgi:membrane-associated phospholipid phosphatase
MAAQKEPLLAGARRILTEDQARIIAAEIPPVEEAGRGRVFSIIYLITLAAFGAGLLLLALNVRGDDIIQWDEAITRALQHITLPVLGWILTRASDLGFFPGNVIVYVAVLGVLFALRFRTESLLGVGASLLAVWVGSLIKIYVARPRPSDPSIHIAAHLTGYSFPSGHVIQYTTLFGFCCYLLVIAWRGTWLRNVVLTVFVALILLVGPSRVYLGEHWPSDVVGAYLFAAMWLAATIELHIWLKRHFKLWPMPEKHRRRARSHG